MEGALLAWTLLPPYEAKHSVRFVSANWDLAEVEREMKVSILEGGGLVNKLCVTR